MTQPPPLPPNLPKARYALAMNGPSATPPVIVVCPLQFELQGLARAGLERYCELHCCGPGAHGVKRWFDRHRPVGRTVVLAGLAGALRPEIAAGSAWIIREALSDASPSERWRPSWMPAPSPDAQPPLRVVSVTCTVTLPREKTLLAERSGADLVDLESATFARTADQLGLKWGIVRGVSDAACDALPPNIDQWVDDRGGTRPVVAGLAVLRRPWLIAHVLRLKRAGDQAMAAIAAHLRDHLAGSDRTATSQNN